MRDYIKDTKYFEIFLDEYQNMIDKFETKLKNNEVKNDRINAIKKMINKLKIDILIAHYSIGQPIDIIKEDFLTILSGYSEFWNPEMYTRNLQIISLGILLNEKELMKEVFLPLLSSSGVNDWLYEFLLVGENDNKFLFEKHYGELKKIAMTNGDEQINLLEEYVTNIWYKAHKDCGWYDSHKSSQNIYCGYWSFEAAAVAKILNIDDEKLKNTMYYPYDLTHFES